MRPRFIVFLLLLLIALLTLGACSLIGGDSTDSSGGCDPDSDSGTIIIRSETVPHGEAGSFTFTGVPTGTVSLDATLVVSDLQPSTYTTTEVDPAPDFDVTGVACDDGGSTTPSSGDATTRTAVFNLDPGETVRCTFTNTDEDGPPSHGSGGEGGIGTSSGI